MPACFCPQKADESCEVITGLEQLQGRLEGESAEVVQKEVSYLQSPRERMDYGTAKQKGGSMGSGESTCRQYQCQSKRPRQFWSQTGDGVLMFPELFDATDAGTCSSLTQPLPKD